MKRCIHWRYRKRPYLLLEVLIALTLVVMCFIPLLRPHLFIVTEERRLLREIDTQRAVRLLFMEILVELYNNTISWKDIEDGNTKDLDAYSSANFSADYEEALTLLRAYGYRAKYFFSTKDSKASEDGTTSCYLLTLTVTLETSKGKVKAYERPIVILRKPITSDIEVSND